jgi:lipid A 3-O-deacylase
LNLYKAAQTAPIGLIFMLGSALDRPAAAQLSFDWPGASQVSLGWPAGSPITLGSPGEPPSFAIGGGAFDVLPNDKHPGSGVTGLVQGDYRFGDVAWIFAPFLGAMGTGKGASYVYVGFGFDLNLPYHFVLTPSFAGGYYQPGRGINLGYYWEFRSGAELGYRFWGDRRFGVGFYHMSNAGLGKATNPGVEFVNAVLTAPF